MQEWSRARQMLAWGAIALLLGACSTLPTDVERPESRALQDTVDTTLGRLAARLNPADDGKTAYVLLNDGLAAFLARSDLIDAAERSLDVQYFVIEGDQTGLRFLERLYAAAERGVRVRLLVDDIGTAGQDRALVAFDAHPNIELRLFNPFALRSTRLLDFMASGGRVNRRMHNKSFNADNQFAIVGGRNIGDEYFEARKDVGFGDFDVILAGPAVRELGDAFDAYWNSEVVLPVTALIEDPATAEEIEALRSALHLHAEEMRDSPYSGRGREANLIDELRAGERKIYRGAAKIGYDLPKKVTDSPDERRAHLGPKLRPLVENARSEVLIMNPYFVPQSAGAEFFVALRKKGVRVKVLTNSLASTDVPAVHSGYHRYREDLLRAGVELYEVRPKTSKAVQKLRRETGGHELPDALTLHAKVFAIDRRYLFVGSMNLDPRSARINTEMGVLIDDPVGATRLAEEFTRTRRNFSYDVALEKTDAGEQMVWTETTPDGERRHLSEPEVGFWLHVRVFFLSLLPVENQL
jgi:putative cardiolipin synthase